MAGGRFYLRYGKYVLLRPAVVARGDRFFERHGSKAVFLARWISVLRTWGALLAGVNRMPWRTFLLWNAVGGISWAIVFGAAGYGAGKAVRFVTGEPLNPSDLFLTGLIGVGLVAAVLVHQAIGWWRRRA